MRTLILISTVALAACGDDSRSSRLPPIQPGASPVQLVYADQGDCGGLPAGAIARVVSRDDVVGTVTVRGIVDDEGPQQRLTIPQSCVVPADSE